MHGSSHYSIGFRCAQVAWVARSAGILLALCILSGCSLLRTVGLLPAAEKEATIQKEEVIPLSEQPYEFVLFITVAADVNLDGQQRPSPVRTRIFLTEPNIELSNLEFEQIFEFDGSQMDPAPLSTIMLQPGESRRIKISGVKSQSTITVASAFRDPYSVNWIASKRINPDTAVRHSVEISATAVTFTAP